MGWASTIDREQVRPKGLPYLEAQRFVASLGRYVEPCWFRVPVLEWAKR